jgi:hypothetical protein
MFFSKKTPEVPKNVPPPPPWANIDAVPKRAVSRAISGLTEITMRATGFGRLGSQLLLFILSAGLAFVAYAVYLNGQAPAQSPPEMQRPAVDKYASSTRPR